MVKTDGPGVMNKNMNFLTVLAPGGHKLLPVVFDKQRKFSPGLQDLEL